MPDEHARLSPSAASRWISCPASVRLLEGLEQAPSSPYAAEGTKAHALAELRLAGERLRVHQTEAIDGHGAPGEILSATRAGIDVACGEGALRVLRLQREGGKPITAAEYLNARPALRT